MLSLNQLELLLGFLRDINTVYGLGLQVEIHIIEYFFWTQLHTL